MRLHGINEGGWLGPQGWFGAVYSSDAARANDVFHSVDQRFTPAQAETLKTTWKDHWLTEVDFDMIKSYQFNMIRVFFSYEAFQNEDGSWKLDAQGNIDFTRMDWLVREAGARGLYVVPTLAGWRTQREDYGLISWYGADADKARADAADLWREVARHYKDNSIMAGFDVLNEPTGSPGNMPHNVLYEAIRAIDPNRMIIMESTGIDSRWSNVMYSIHDYNMMGSLANNQASLAQNLTQYHAFLDNNVPVYIGEFMTGSDFLPQLLKQYNDLGIHWSPFEYKAVDMGGWAVVDLFRAPCEVNIDTDSYEHILLQWSNLATTTSNNYKQNVYIQAYQAANADAEAAASAP